MPFQSEVLNFIDGRFVESENKFDNVNPVDGTVIGQVHEAGTAQVDMAVSAARNAMAGPWARTTATERAALLRRIAGRIEDRFDDLLHAEVMDTGKPVPLAREHDVARAAANFRSFADTLAAHGLDAYLTDLPGGRQALNYAVPNPLGVVAIVVPWNMPLLLLTWKLAPALACGNAVVVKPSERTPSSATLLAEILTEAGVPDGVYNVVHGFGPGSAGELLTTSSRINGVTFTGESTTGSAIMRAVAPHVLPVSFELGGKNAAIVFDDADMTQAVAGLGRSVFTNSGQVCLCTERVYVQRGVFDVVAEGLARHADELVLGPPSDPRTTTGPLISVEHRDKVLSYLRRAREDGGQVLVGGSVPELGGGLDSGAWIEPTLWTGLDHSSSVLTEEVFGPVAALVPFDSEEEVVGLANDTDFGLAASIWTQDIGRGHRVAQQMRVGMAWVNTWYTRDLRSPFGGSGLSGIGREGGTHSLHFYSQPTNVCVQL